MKILALSLLAGIASATGFAPLGLWPVTLAAFALLLHLVWSAPRLRTALARGYWFGVGHFALGLNWIATAFTFQSEMPVWLGWIAVVLLAFYIAVYPAMAAGLAWRWGRGDRTATVLIFAAGWIVTEWLRATMFTGFAWNPLGVSLLDTGVAAAARWTGTYGLSGLTALLAGAAWLLIVKQRRAGLAIFAGLALVFVAAQLGSGPPAGARPVPVRIVQPNIGQQDKWKPGFERRNFERLARLSAIDGTGPRLLLWPEAAVTRPLQDQRRYGFAQADAAVVRESVGAILAPRDLLLTGGITYRSADGADVTSATNSIFAMNAAGRILGRFDKAHLVPYGEYLPMRPILSAIGLSRLSPGDIDFDSGPGPQTLTLPVAGKVGFQLCYEIIFSGQVVDRANRPGFIFNPSNDAWFGAWGPPQHLAQARLRALEEGLPVLRATPTGISAIIDADGRILRQIGWNVAGVIDAPLPAPKSPTAFARFGNILPFALALLLAAAAVAVRRRER
ncbi:apolipoprotein N-acyltransferase [Allosphingosinicella indica]|uniref:Apolipoprotein N-acyltransferase n=1 Tax=Allosphingosinicella indica TaxID=941907 RepID=A0A1X7G095_9SPHN|nr:apolipoprotein N-acyltransferase [Allosphingosinicella indica]SMF61784.1 Apolipoprotein N-acyltransferase [Allosphingosinicella indica]